MNQFTRRPFFARQSPAAEVCGPRGLRPCRDPGAGTGMGDARLSGRGRSPQLLRSVEYCIPAMSDGMPRSGRVRARAAPHAAGAAVSPRLEPIASPDSFKSRAYAALKDAIVAMDIYRSRTDIRLDER